MIHEAKLKIDIDEATFRTKTDELFEANIEISDVDSVLSQLVTFCSKTHFNVFLSRTIELVLERNQSDRKKWGSCLGQLFLAPTYDCSEIFEG